MEEPGYATRTEGGDSLTVVRADEAGVTVAHTADGASQEGDSLTVFIAASNDNKYRCCIYLNRQILLSDHLALQTDPRYIHLSRNRDQIITPTKPVKRFFGLVSHKQTLWSVFYIIVHII